MINRPMTVKEAAEYLGVSPEKLKRDRRLGRGAAYCRLDRRIIYRLQDLEVYLESCRVVPGK